MPADEAHGRVVRRGGRAVHVRIEPVHDPEPRVVDVAEHVGGEQRRREQEDDVHGHDRADRQPRRDRPRARAGEREQVAGGHRDEQRGARRRLQDEPDTVERAGQPVREAASPA